LIVSEADTALATNRIVECGRKYIMTQKQRAGFKVIETQVPSRT
jgi:hypothetical protein